MNLAGRGGPTRRVLRLALRLQQRPYSLAELQAELQIGPLQLGRDLDLLREEGFPVQTQGKPAMVWIAAPEVPAAAPPAVPAPRARPARRT